mmetsp:Transcript_128955/g.412993  ORF Transcript_128955/g.412993 Transcript_128955/m.412993 type:complete len:235 (+) Transcript_128955:1465-2169(+)
MPSSRMDAATCSVSRGSFGSPSVMTMITRLLCARSMRGCSIPFANHRGGASLVSPGSKERPSRHSCSARRSPSIGDTTLKRWWKRTTPIRTAGISMAATTFLRNCTALPKSSAPTEAEESTRNTMSRGFCTPLANSTTTCGSVCTSASHMRAGGCLGLITAGSAGTTSVSARRDSRPPPRCRKKDSSASPEKTTTTTRTTTSAKIRPVWSSLSSMGAASAAMATRQLGPAWWQV